MGKLRATATHSHELILKQRKAEAAAAEKRAEELIEGPAAAE